MAFTAPKHEINDQKELLGGGGFVAPGSDKREGSQSSMDAANELLGSRQELKPYGGMRVFKGIDATFRDATMGAIDAAKETLISPIRAGQTMSQPGFRNAGGAVAESLGAEGINPNIAAGAGTLLAMVPDAVQAGGVVRNIMKSPGIIQRAIRSTPKMLGEEFEAGKRAAGISENLPVQRGSAARFPEGISKGIEPDIASRSLPMAPTSYPKDPNTFINFVKDRISNFGDKLTPQELNDTKTILATMMRNGKLQPGTQPFAVASKLNKDVTALHNAAIPGREELNKIYSLSKTLHGENVANSIREFITKYGKRALAETAAIALGGAAASQFFKK